MSNVTKDGIEVRPGQIWRDLDSRMQGRTREVLAVVDGKAHMGGGTPKTRTVKPKP